jgi:RNA recognition motif-containing protein
MNIYVGNLNFRTTEQQIADLFAQYGEVTSVKIVKDQETGRSKGFAFVEMADDMEASNAIQALNEAEFGQRNLVVNEARPKTDRPDRGNFRPRDNSRRY